MCTDTCMHLLLIPNSKQCIIFKTENNNPPHVGLPMPEEQSTFLGFTRNGGRVITVADKLEVLIPASVIALQHDSGLHLNPTQIA